MANSVLETIQQILTCSICMDIFIDPRLLPCQHTLCQKCLTSCIKKTKKKGRSKTMFRCPMCRHEVMFDKLDPSTYTFSKNMTMQHFLDEFEEDINDVIDNHNETQTKEYGTQTDQKQPTLTQNSSTQTFQISRKLLCNKLKNAISMDSLFLVLVIGALKTLPKVIWLIVEEVIIICFFPFCICLYLLKTFCFAPALFLLRKLWQHFDILKSGLEGNDKNATKSENKTLDGNSETTANSNLQEVVIVIGILLYSVFSTSLYVVCLAYPCLLFSILVLFLKCVQQTTPKTHTLPLKRRRGRLMASQVRFQKRLGH